LLPLAGYKNLTLPPPAAKGNVGAGFSVRRHRLEAYATNYIAMIDEYIR